MIDKTRWPFNKVFFSKREHVDDFRVGLRDTRTSDFVRSGKNLERNNACVEACMCSNFNILLLSCS